jgi:hypothetical protein
MDPVEFPKSKTYAGARPAPSKPTVVPVAPAAAASAGTPREPVTLVKGAHRWTFSCDPGDEGELLRRISELARSPEAPLDWFDAALISHQLSRRLKSGLQRIDAGSPGTSP